MADDGMILNFDLGAAPAKPQVKFTGGRWRDRKRMQKSVREGTGQDSGRDDTAGERSSKRQRVDTDWERPKFNPTTGSSGRKDNSNNNDSSGDNNKQQGGGSSAPVKRTGPVISKLFSYNPVQKTEVEKQEAWTAPEPTNAPLSSVANFGTLELNSRLVDALAKLNLERPTAIQSKVIPHMLSGSGDAFVQAETGSGKTFSYLLPILHRVLQLTGKAGTNQIHRDSGVFAIIVSPTRELARQTHDVLEQVIRPFPWLVSTAITGGESKKAEKARIRKGVNFLVATPGRLADHIDNTKSLNLGTVRWLILDEGDRLMDLGFEEDLRKTISTLKNIMVVKETITGVSLETLPDRRVTVLCSATMKMNVQKLGEMSLADATFLAAEKREGDPEPNTENTVLKAPAQLHQTYIIVPSKLRLVTLISYLKSVFARRGKTMKAIIFMACADSVDFHYELLKDPTQTELPESAAKDGNLSKTVAKSAYITGAASPEVILHRMHGSLPQSVRTATIKAYSASKLPSVLITTDVSSRGLDIPSVDLVIEYDPAFSFADHIHRVGRTARAGRAGDAVLFLLPGTEEGYIELLKTSTPPTAQPYEKVLQKGLLSKLVFPIETNATPTDGQTYHEKAETMQLHIEQRLLLDSKQLELARNGFKSHIRAYATHVKDEREHFDISELHLGHVAKSFGLREAPGGIGNGIDRKAAAASKKRKAAGGKPGQQKDSRDHREDRNNANNVALGERDGQDLIRQKSNMLMRGMADEFNIG